MTAEAFIKEKLIPKLSDAVGYYRASLTLAENQGGTLGIKENPIDPIVNFIEQHRSEWEGR